VYASSGYGCVNNLFHDTEDNAGRTRRKKIAAMVKPLSNKPWPTSKVHLPGPTF